MSDAPRSSVIDVFKQNRAFCEALGLDSHHVTDIKIELNRQGNTIQVTEQAEKLAAVMKRYRLVEAE